MIKEALINRISYDAGAHVVSTNRVSPSSMRRRVYRRDKGVCAICGIDTAVLGKVLQAEWQRIKLARNSQERRERSDFRKRYRWFFRRASYWDADHIVPVVEGGGDCTIENIRTLCVPCHQQVTKELARRRASQRRQRWASSLGRVALKIAES